MTDKELRRLNRRELLEMLIEQGRELEKVRQELDAATEKLNKREIEMAECGSIAEAALKLSGIFEAAQEAADRYLESVKAANADQGEPKAAAEEVLCGEEQNASTSGKDSSEMRGDDSQGQREVTPLQDDDLRREMK